MTVQLNMVMCSLLRDHSISEAILKKRNVSPALPGRKDAFEEYTWQDEYFLQVDSLS
jgi:hypothetical protein